MKRILLGCVGACAGYCVGWVVAVIVAAYAGHLHMPTEVYEEKKTEIRLTHYVIVGSNAIAGAALFAFGIGKVPGRSSRTTWLVIAVRLLLVIFISLVFIVLTLGLIMLAMLLRYLLFG